MTILHFTNHCISLRWLIKSFLLVIFATLLTTWSLVGCRQQDLNKPIGFFNLGRLGYKTIPATVYIEVIDREETVEPLPSFMADPFFRHYFDVDKLHRKFSDELVGAGTGMIIDTQGHILTNSHVVRGATMIEVRLANGRWCPAKLIGTDPQTDLAVIWISDQAVSHVTFGDSDFLEEGEPVAIVGYMGRICEILKPRLTPTVYGGIIRAVQPNGITFCSVWPNICSTNAGSNSGNSGALLLNRQGEVIGVDVAIVSQPDDARTIGFAIPSNTAANIAAQLISYRQEGVK